jgi:hypothetical protein
MGSSILPICYVTATVISAATESIGTVGAHSSSQPPFLLFLLAFSKQHPSIRGNVEKVFFSLA